MAIKYNKTNAISSFNGKGTHTSTSRQLLQHSSGCTVIGTPGIRELKLWTDEDILSESFQYIYSLSDQCKYRDCKHDKEVGLQLKKLLRIED
ncbi:GTPase RsgA [Clostridium sp. MSJ-4]|uniref:GTPase RsgA n=1 Tax=Clostridium simiarum TaxID=2841506 RepID=A0ABS6EYG0_9CLOT|nr:GTPase RsgA [Clostridium simiarum]